MTIIYSNTVKNTRLNAVVSAIGATGVLEIGTAGMTTVLVTIPLANPAGVVSGGVLTFTLPLTDSSADATGTAAAARIRTSSGGTDIATGLTVGTSEADIVLSTVSITAGNAVTLTSATITHG